MRGILIAIVVLLGTFGIVAAQETEIACTNDEMIAAVQAVSDDFTAGIEAGDDVIKLFDTAQIMLQLARAKCIPTPIFRSISQGESKITIGLLPDGDYVFEFIGGGPSPITLSLDPEYDSSGCGIDPDTGIQLSMQNPPVITTKSCDLHLISNSQYDWYLLLKPIDKRDQ